jgi:hypothetical protein
MPSETSRANAATDSVRLRHVGRMTSCRYSGALLSAEPLALSAVLSACTSNGPKQPLKRPSIFLDLTRNRLHYTNFDLISSTILSKTCSRSVDVS